MSVVQIKREHNKDVTNEQPQCHLHYGPRYQDRTLELAHTLNRLLRAPQVVTHRRVVIASAIFR